MSRVLVIEDDPLNQQVLDRFLGTRGHQVTVCGSAEDGVKRLSEGAFDAILLDNVLPGMTGLQSLTEIVSRSQAPVVVMTGHADEELRKDAMLLGAKAFLYKPFDFHLLDRLLQELLSRK